MKINRLKLALSNINAIKNIILNIYKVIVFKNNFIYEENLLKKIISNYFSNKKKHSYIHFDLMDDLFIIISNEEYFILRGDYLSLKNKNNSYIKKLDNYSKQYFINLIHKYFVK